MKPVLSVIVPIYNVEQYLTKCLESIVNQTYKNLEIILVDDGSNDNSPAICDEYAEKDSRVKVIHKVNGGLSDARNVGIQHSSGKYIAFIDSDDWIDANWCKVLIGNLVQEQADISVSGIISESNGICKCLTSEYGNQVFSETGIEMMSRYFQTAWVAWDKIYKAELFDGIRFPVGEINEDEAIVLQLLEKCSKVVYTNEVFYHYIHRPSSITTSSFSPKKFAWYRHCRDNLAWIREHHPELTEAAAARYRGAILYSLTEIALSDTAYTEEQQDLLKELKKEKKLFSAIPFDAVTEKIRYTMLAYLPFSFYRICIRRKRNV